MFSCKEFTNYVGGIDVQYTNFYSRTKQNCGKTGDYCGNPQEIYKISDCWETVISLSTSGFKYDVYKPHKLLLVVYVKGLTTKTKFVLARGLVSSTVDISPLEGVQNSQETMQAVVFDVTGMSLNSSVEFILTNNSAYDFYIFNSKWIIDADVNNQLPTFLGYYYYKNFGEVVYNQLCPIELNGFGSGKIDMANRELLTHNEVISSSGANLPIVFDICNRKNNSGKLGLNWSASFEYTINMNSESIEIIDYEKVKQTYWKISVSYAINELNIGELIGETRTVYVNPQDLTYILFGNNPHGSYELRIANKVKLFFGGSKITRIEQSSHWIQYTWESNNLIEIKNSDGDQVIISYNDNNLISKVDFTNDKKCLDFLFDLNKCKNIKYSTYILNEEIIEYSTYKQISINYDGSIISNLIDTMSNRGVKINTECDSYDKINAYKMSYYYLNTTGEIIYDDIIRYYYSNEYSNCYWMEIMDKNKNVKKLFFNEYGTCKTIVNPDSSIETFSFKRKENQTNCSPTLKLNPIFEDKSTIINPSFELPLDFINNDNYGWKRSDNSNIIVRTVDCGVDNQKCLLIDSIGVESVTVFQRIKRKIQINNNLKGYVKISPRTSSSQILDNSIVVNVILKYTLNKSALEMKYSSENFDYTGKWIEFEMNNINFPLNSTSKEIEIQLQSNLFDGKVWFDDLSLNNEKKQLYYNYLKNSWFSDNDLEFWNCNNTYGIIDPIAEIIYQQYPIYEKRYIILSDQHVINQKAKMQGVAGDELLFMFWCSLLVNFDDSVIVYIDVNYHSELALKRYSFKIDYTDNGFWHVQAYSVIAEHNYDEITVGIEYAGNARSHFTGFQLYKGAFTTNYEITENEDSISISNNSKKRTITKNTNTVKVKEEPIINGAFKRSEVEYVYDENEQLTKINDNGIIIEYIKSDNEREITERTTTKSGRTIIKQQILDNNKNIIVSTDEKGFIQNNLYTNNLITTSFDKNGAATKYEYNKQDLLIKRHTFLNDVEDICKYKFDDKYRISEVKSGNNTLYKFIYGRKNSIKEFKINNTLLTKFDYNHIINYDNNINIFTDYITSKSYSNSIIDYTFSYNNSLQLEHIKYRNQLKTSYQYDLFGNISKVTDHNNDITKNFVYNINNQLVYLFDSNGDNYRFEYGNFGETQSSSQSIGANKVQFNYTYLSDHVDNDVRVTSTSYFCSSIYSDMDLVTLNGGTTSLNGILPSEKSFIKSAVNSSKYNAFYFDSKKSIHDKEAKDRYVYQSYDSISTKPKLSYYLDLNLQGTLSIWVKPSSSFYNNKRYIFSAIKQSSTTNYNISNLGLYFNNNYELFATRNIGGIGYTKNQHLLPDIWQLITLRYKQDDVSISINGEPFIKYLSNQIDLTGYEMMLGATNAYNSNEPINHLNGLMEMFAFTGKYLSNNEINNIYERGRLSQVTSNYDFDGRLIEKIVDTNANKIKSKYLYYDEEYIVQPIPEQGNPETKLKFNPLVSSEILPNGSNIVYSYDELNNITHKVTLSKSGLFKEAINYTYNGLNQLATEKRWKNNNIFDYYKEYLYDNNGNITLISSFSDTNQLISKSTYTYDDCIKDKLVSIITRDNHDNIIDKKTISYQHSNILNPTTIVHNNSSINLSWEGRRLLSYGNNIYTYDENGIRISKQKGNLKTKYFVLGQKITHTQQEVMIQGVKRLVEGDYIYDENNSLVGLNVDNKDYYYIRDITGNINKIVDINNTVMIEYTYDGWGKPTISINNELDDSLLKEANILSIINPFLFKGYCYDSETSLYYCNSRYYNPEWGRWLNADDVSYLDPSSVNGLNLYTYCINNPIMYFDPDGHMPKWLAWTLSATAVVGGVILCATGVGGILGGVLIGAGASSIINGYLNEANGGDFTAGYIGGAISGALCGIGAGLGGLAFAAAGEAVNAACLGYLALGAVTSFAGGFAGNLAGTVATSWIDSGFKGVNINWGETLATSSIMGALNIFAGLGSGMSTIVGSAGKTAIDINTKFACRILAGGIAGGTETFYDLTSYLIGRLLSRF